MMTDKQLADVIIAVVKREVEALSREIDAKFTNVDDSFEMLNSEYGEKHELLSKGHHDKVIEIDKAKAESEERDNNLSKLIDEQVETMKSYEVSMASINKHFGILSDTVDNNSNEVESKLKEIDTIQEEIKGKHETFAEEAIKMIDKKCQEIDVNCLMLVDEKTEAENLKSKVYIQDELLRLNAHINQKLDILKGDKGDKGDKGQPGEKGFLTMVKAWQGDTVEHEVVTHNGGLWQCKSDTKEAPGETDDFNLIFDGVKELKLVDGDLIANKTSGEEINMGCVALSVAGVFDKTKSYKKNAIVQHNKSSWISLKDNNSNHPPSNSWIQLAGKGQKGEPGKQGLTGTKGLDFNIDDVVPIIESVIDTRIEK